MHELQRRAEVAEIVASIWRSSIEPKFWEDVVLGLNRLIPRSLGGAVFSPFHAGPGGFHVAANAKPKFIQGYLEENLGARDPLQHALYRKLPTERLVSRVKPEAHPLWSLRARLSRAPDSWRALLLQCIPSYGPSWSCAHACCAPPSCGANAC